MLGFLKSINIPAVAAGAILCAAGVYFLTSQSAEIGSLKAQLEAAKFELTVSQKQTETAVKSCNDQLAAIKTLELQRGAGQAAVQAIEDRLNSTTKPKTDTSNVKSPSLADQLNSINGDAIRMLEQSSK